METSYDEWTPPLKNKIPVFFKVIRPISLLNTSYFFDALVGMRRGYVQGVQVAACSIFYAEGIFSQDDIISIFTITISKSKREI